LLCGQEFGCAFEADRVQGRSLTRLVLSFEKYMEKSESPVVPAERHFKSHVR